LTGEYAVAGERFEVDGPHAEGAEEEIFFVLGGSGLSWQDGEVFEVGESDALVHLPEQHAHTLRAGPDGLDVLIAQGAASFESWTGLEAPVAVMRAALSR